MLHGSAPSATAPHDGALAIAARVLTRPLALPPGAALTTSYRASEFEERYRRSRIESRMSPPSLRAYSVLPTARTRISYRPDSATLAVIGASSYLILFALPLAADVPLLGLAVCTALAVLVADRGETPPRARRLAGAVALFFVSIGLSLLVADDVQRGVVLSRPLVPGALLFVVIAGHFRDLDDTRRLYAAFAVTALAVGAAVLAEAWRHPALDPSALVASLGSPALVVPNDVALLAVAAPLAWALLQSTRRYGTALLAGTSLLVSAGAIAVLQSRVAALAMISGIACSVAARSWRRAAVAVVSVAAVVLTVDAVRGLPLLHKFAPGANPRIALWIAALAMFRDAPWLGQGPHAFGALQDAYAGALVLPPWIPLDERAVPWTHNLYLETLAEQGIVGFLALGVMLATAVRLAYAAAAEARDRDVRVLAAGALGSLVAVATAGLVELSFIREWVVVVTFTLLGIISHHTALPLPAPQPQEVPS